MVPRARDSRMAVVRGPDGSLRSPDGALRGPDGALRGRGARAAAREEIAPAKSYVSSPRDRASGSAVVYLERFRVSLDWMI